MSITIQVPNIESASFSVNPVYINGSTVLSVKVSEKTIELFPEIFYSGEIHSGEA